MNDIIKWCFEKQTFSSSFLIITGLILFRPLVDKINVFKYVVSDPFTDLVIILIGIAIIFHYVYYLVLYRHVYSKRITWLVFTIGLTYIVVRFFITDYWFFYSFSCINYKGIYYADIILLILICHSIVLILSRIDWHEPKQGKMSIFEVECEDNEINNGLKVEDNYLRDEIIKKFTTEILLLEPVQSSIAIGIVGPWGTGKTWFMNGIKRSLGDGIIKIDLNSWRANNKNNITTDLFNSLKTNLSKYNGNLSNIIDEYLSGILRLDKSQVSTYFYNSIGNTSDIDSGFQNVKKGIEEINRKIFVFIDDLDRLDKEELSEVLRLVRNTANFKGLYFVVAYDKQYLLEAIKTIYTHNYRKFLDKIFPIEKVLPILPNYLLLKEFEDKILQFLDSDSILEKNRDKIKLQFKELHEEIISPISFGHINKDISSAGKFSIEDFNLCISSGRDLMKLLNSFKFKILILQGENISFKKLFLLELICLVDFPIYEKLIYNRNEFLNYIEKFTYYELQNQSYKARSIVNKLLRFVFDYNPKYKYNYGHPALRQYFDSYFEAQGSIKLSEFEKLLNKPSVEMIKQALFLLNNKKQNDLIKLISDHSEFKNFKEFENIILLTLHLCKMNYVIQEQVMFRLLNYEKVNKLYQDKYGYFEFLDALVNSSQFYEPFRELFHITLFDYAINNEMSYVEIEHVFCSSSYLVDEKDNFYPAIVEKFENYIHSHPLDFIKNNIRAVDDSKDKFEAFKYNHVLFRKAGDIKNFLVQHDDGYFSQELLTFYRRYRANSYRPIRFERGTIEIVSDTNTKFFGGEKYHNGVNKNAVEFNHHDDWERNIITNTPIFKGIRWVAKDELIDNKEEQFNGDIYRFYRLFKIPEGYNVVKANFSMYVDDVLLELRLNNSKLNKEEIETGDTKVFRAENIDCSLFKDSVENWLEFKIRNKSFKEIAGNRSLETVQIGENPYGIIYILELQVKQKDTFELW